MATNKTYYVDGVFGWTVFKYDGANGFLFRDW